MAKDSIRDFSATAGSNTDIQSVNIDENCPASGINNAIRELMVDLKNVSTGAVNLETPGADQLNVDNLRLDGNTISTTSGDMTLDAVGDVIIDADGADIRLKHAGTEWGRFVDSTNNFLILNPIADKDIIFNGIDGSSEISALTLDMSEAGKATFNNHVVVNDRVVGADDLVLVTTDSNEKIHMDSDGFIKFETAGSERMRITSDGHFLHGKTSKDYSSPGTHLYPNGEVNIVRDQLPLYVNRLSTNGTVIAIAKDSVTQGQIDVSGTTVTYNGGHLGRWSQATDGKRIDGLVKGTVMTNLDQMAVWSHDEVLWTEDDDLPDGVSVGDVRKAAFTEDNEQLNCMAVSSVEGDINVAGCFIRWDEDDQVHTNDMTVAMTGDFVIRIAKGTTVARGDLLMSAGDGTAKPQDDDIIRSKTIAKVTSTTVSHTYDDGSYLVPCVLMAC